jgi:hypothetical protein
MRGVAFLCDYHGFRPRRGNVATFLGLRSSHRSGTADTLTVGHDARQGDTAMESLDMTTRHYIVRVHSNDTVLGFLAPYCSIDRERKLVPLAGAQRYATQQDALEDCYHYQQVNILAVDSATDSIIDPPPTLASASGRRTILRIAQDQVQGRSAAEALVAVATALRDYGYFASLHGEPTDAVLVMSSDRNEALLTPTDWTFVGQRRARAGGEYGANGEWYEGGKFIATRESTIRTTKMRHELTPDELVRHEAEKANRAATVERLNAWLSARAEQFKDLLAVLESEPRGTGETFWQSLARQIRDSGSLSPKQSRHAVKAMFGRETKANSEAYWTMFEALQQNFK